MKTAIIDIIKWSIIAIITAIAFYSVVPKYQPYLDTMRFNKITGAISYVDREFGK